MEKQQDLSVIACVFLFLSLASKIQSTSQIHFLNHRFQSKQEIGSSVDTTHFNAIRRVSVSSPQTTVSGVTQQELKQKDLIKQLPGQPPVSFKQYGGYVAIDKSHSRFFYYYFVETMNANSSAPLVICFNGGPACSSLEGAFEEHGPFRVHSDGKTLYRNPYSWNKEANILYVESPAGVGFSYVSTKWNLKNQRDKNTAEDNYAFLVNWLERFSEYKGRDFYITGQSYAGHYCPQLAQLILHNKNQTPINLRGVLIGNPGLDKRVEDKGRFKYLFNHALITEESMNTGDKATVGRLGWNMNMYNIYAPMCKDSTLTSIPDKDATVKNFDPCSDEYMIAYLNRANVQEAMHANTTTHPYEWTMCNEEATNFWNVGDKFASMIPILKELMGNNVRVWVYSGDTDSMVSYTSTMDVLRKMNLTVENAWRPWYCNGELGGHTEEYKNKFTYAIVRGAGHSVPSDQPIRALDLFTSFIRDQNLSY